MFEIIRKLFNKIDWKLAQKRFKKIGKNSYMGLDFLVTHPECMIIGDDFTGGKGVRLQAWPFYKGAKTNYTPHLIIGNNVSATERTCISCLNRIEIGDGCLLGSDCFITDNFHGRNDSKELELAPNERELYSKGPVIIGKNVWIGKNVCVMPGVEIGDGSVIGANSTVTHSIPPYSIAVGSPAHVIRRVR
jgi:acetyltransferase-like isoleucine patch superfamily enzyme